MSSADPILILALLRVGDLIQLTPLAQGLKRTRPESPVAVCVLPEFVPAARLMEGVDEIVEFDRDALFRISLRNDLPVSSMLGEAETVLAPLLSRKFGMAINMTMTPLSNQLMYLIDAPDKRGPVMTATGGQRLHHPWMMFIHSYVINKDTSPFNLVDMCARTGDPGPGGERGGLSIRIPDGAREWASDYVDRNCPGDGPLVAVHMGASDAHKMWHPSSFIKTCELIRQRDESVRILFVGGKAERGFADRAHEFLGGRGVAVAAGETDLPRLAALLGRCDLMITNDTGPMHIAAAAGTRVLALAIGPIHYSNTAPYGEGHAVFQPRAACAPCAFHVRCVNPECKQMISPQAVADVARRMLDGDPLPARSIPVTADYAECNVYATEWGPDGLLDYRPLLDRPPGFLDRLVRAYRTVWLGSLLGDGPLPGEDGPVRRSDDGIFPALGRLEALALQGKESAAYILKHVGSAGSRPSLAERVETLRGCMDAVRDLGMSFPGCNSLCLMFAREEEKLGEAEGEAAIRGTVELFGKLLRRTRSLAYLLADGECAGQTRREGRG